MLIISVFLPYWQLTLYAPQYPKGLSVQAYVNDLEGDVGEIDGLNHYIGMRPLHEAAAFEKSIAIFGIIGLALLILAAIFVHTWWAALLALPALLLPVIFLVDLQYWLANFGQNLDPTAPLSSSVDPFIPPVLGEGNIAQFSTWSEPLAGLWLAIAASCVIAVGLWFHRRAYKPLVETAQSADRSATAVRARKRNVTMRSLLLSLWLLLLITAGSPAPVQARSVPFDLAAQVDAALPGAVVEVPAGLYPGPLTLDKPVTLRGAPGAIIEGGGSGSVITVNAPDVTLEGLTVRNSGDSLDREDSAIVGLAPRLTVRNNQIENALFGIYLKNAPNSLIQGNTVLAKDLPIARRGDGIRAWYSEGTTVVDNHVLGSRDVVIWFSPKGVVRNNLVEQGRYGLHFMFSDDQIVEDNTVRDNSVGVYVMYGTNLQLRDNHISASTGPSGYGLGLKDVDDIWIEDNEITGNRVGIYVDNSPREPDGTVEFTHNFIGYNQIGVTMLPSVQRNQFTANTFQDNEEQIAVAGSGDLTKNAWSQANMGNYWSDYAGFDADGDQIGDLPYVAQSFYESLLALYPELRIFQLSPATAALDLATLRAFPSLPPIPRWLTTTPSWSRRSKRARHPRATWQAHWPWRWAWCW